MKMLVSGLLRKIAEEVNKSTFLTAVANQVRDYFRVGWRKEISDAINYRDLMYNAVASLDPTDARKVLDEFSYYVLSKKSLDPIYKNDEKSLKKIEDKLEGLNPTERMWEEGIGSDVDARLRSMLKDLLIKERMAKPSELNDIVNKILMKETGVLEKREKQILSAIGKQINAFVAKQLQRYLKNTQKTVLIKEEKKVPQETLEPGPSDWEKGITQEKVDPAISKQEGFDIEEINAYVEKYFSDPEKMVYFNAIAKEPLSAKDLLEKIEEETKQKLSQPTLSRMRDKVLKRVKDQFFSKMPEPEKEKNVSDILSGLPQKDLEDFSSYVDENYELIPQGKAKTDLSETAYRGNLLHAIELLAKGKDYKEIAKELEVKEQDVKNYAFSVIKPLYKKWLKYNKSAATQDGAMDRLYELVTALDENIPEEENISAVQSVLAGLEGQTVTNQLLILRELCAAEDDDAEPDDAQEDEPERTYPKEDDKKSPQKETKPERAEPTEKKKKTKSKPKELSKEELRDKLKNIMEKRILRTHKPEDMKHFKVTVEFESKFDWDDIGKGKYDPELDPNEGWVKDDPEFKWTAFNAHIDYTMNVGKSEFHYVYGYRQKLHDNGTNDGEAVSSLRISKDDKEFITETGPAFYRDFLDKYFDETRKVGLPVERNLPLSVRYLNTRLNRKYHNTSEFLKKMGGLAISDEYHGEKAKQYKDFQLRKERYHTGPGLTIKKFNEKEMATSLKNIAKKPHISPDDKAKAEKLLKEIKNLPADQNEKQTKLREIEQFLTSHYESEKDLHKDVDIF